MDKIKYARLENMITIVATAVAFMCTESCWCFLLLINLNVVTSTK